MTCFSVASQLRNCIAAVNKDSTKFFEGNNKAAGTRARKHLQELKSLAQVRLSSVFCCDVCTLFGWCA